MLLQLLLARLILGALNKSLVKDLEDQLKQCTNIVKFTRSFYQEVPNFSDNRRRLTADSKDDGEGLGDDVVKSLSTCMSVSEALNDFYKALDDYEVDTGADGCGTDPIILNVGGARFSTTLDTLRTGNDTFFDKMFGNGSITACSADGTIFIDRNPKTFQYILDFIRNGDIVVKSTDRDLRYKLHEDAEFFELSNELKEYLRFISLAGIDLSLSEVTWLNNELPGRKLGGLLFDTSKDGDAASTFHAQCDNEGATVTIVETTLGVVFGGFTAQSWSSSNGGQYVPDSSAFVFRLRPTPMRKFKVSSSSTAIYRRTAYGPHFGNNAFHIENNCQDNAKSYVSSGSYYDLGSYALNDGSQDFRVKHYAVVQAV